jgi:hypothetical protein
MPMIIHAITVQLYYIACLYRPNLMRVFGLQTLVSLVSWVQIQAGQWCNTDFKNIFQIRDVGVGSLVVKVLDVVSSNPGYSKPTLCPWERHCTYISPMHSNEKGEPRYKQSKILSVYQCFKAL